MFLDRDGVLNRAPVRDGRPHPPSTLDELEILPGVPAAVARLRQADFMAIVVTNQPDIARGVATKEVVEQLNDALAAAVPIHEVLVCPHDDADGCACRKPRPGLLLEAAARLQVDLTRSFMVGDRWRDVEAGSRAGCTTVFIDRAYDERRPSEADLTVDDLPSAVDWILVADGHSTRRMAVSSAPPTDATIRESR